MNKIKIWNWTLVLLLSACGQKSEVSIREDSKEICDCFSSKTTGTLDDRLTPCFQKIVDQKRNEFSKSTNNNMDSIENKVNKFSLDIYIELTRSCDKYFTEINTIYDNGYPLDSSANNKEEIILLTKQIVSETNQDSIKSMLHKKVYRLIQSRQFELALETIDVVKSLDKGDYGSNLARAYIFNQTEKHDNATDEIEEAIKLSGNQNLILYSEVTKRKKQMGIGQ